MTKSFDNISRLVVGELDISQDQKKSYKITMTGDALKFLNRSNSSETFVLNKDGSFTLPIAMSSSPNSPASGGVVYTKNDGKLYFKNSSGTEYNLTESGGGAGDITGVAAGVGLSGGGTTGDVTLTLDVSELSALGTNPANSDFVVIQDVTDNSTKKVLVSNLIANTGDIQGVTAGTGLSGGGTSGTVSLTTNDSQIVHDNLSGFVANEHVDHSTVSITAGTGLSGGGDLTSTITLSVDLSELTDMTSAINSSEDELILLDNGADRRKLISEIPLSAFDNDSGFTSNTGDITQVIAGNGLTGGGLSGGVTLTVGAGTGIDVATNSISVDVSDFMSNGSNNRVVTATGTDAMNAESNLEFNGSTLTVTGDANISGEVQTAKIAYTDGDDAITIEDGGYLKFAQGNKYSDSVLVSSGYNNNHNEFIKFASYTDRDSQNTTETTFLVTTVGWEDSTDHDGDGSFIVNVKYTYNTSSPYYFSTGTRVTCEAINGSTLNGFNPSTDVILTVGSAGADLYIKAKEQFKRCFVSILGGTNQNDTSVTDQSWQILTGQSWAASITSQGTDIGGSWVDKTFKDVTAASLDISGDVDIDGTLEADAITVNSTALDTHIAGVTVTNATNAANVIVASDYDVGTLQYLLFSDAGNGSDGKTVRYDNGLNYNPGTNVLTVANLDISEDVDIDGTLETDALSINGTTVTATATELNYVAGVTGAIQTQLNAKAPTASPTFTGNATFDTDTLYVDSSGNKVGIGTTSPYANLSIEGDADGGVVSIRLGADNSSASNFSGRLEMAEDTNGSQVMNYGAFLDYDGDADSPHNGMLHLGVRDNSTSDTNVLSISRKAAANSLFISGSGYVGIGTNNPQAPLDVLNGSTLLAQTIIDGVSTQFSCQTASTTYKQINDDTDASKKASITFKVPASRKVMVTLRMAIRDYDASEHLWRVRITDSDSESTEGSWGSNFNDDQYNGHTEEHFGITTCQWYFDGTNSTHNWTVGETKTMYFQIKVNSTIETIQIKAGNEYAPMSITAESVPANVTFVDMDN